MTKNFWSKQVALIVLIAILTATSSAIWADDNESTFQPLALRKIMQKLGRDMQLVTDGISREDWEQVAKTAALIADHPQPPIAEKIRILRFTGAEVNKFKSFDRQTHLAAKKLEEIAMKKDGKGAIAQFTTLQASCLACHRSFRKTFTEHFYGK